ATTRTPSTSPPRRCGSSPSSRAPGWRITLSYRNFRKLPKLYSNLADHADSDAIHGRIERDLRDGTRTKSDRQSDPLATEHRDHVTLLPLRAGAGIPATRGAGRSGHGAAGHRRADRTAGEPALRRR